jgi:hypothetical protein
VSRNGHDDIATRLRREGSVAAPDRLRADVMLRVRAEPRPRRIGPRRSFGRSFASVAAAACILGALVFGLSRVDFGGGSSSSGAGGGSTAAAGAAKSLALPGAASGSKSPARSEGSTQSPHSLDRQALPVLAPVPRPLRAAILGRAALATPLRHTFGALDPYHQRSGR